MGDKVKYKIQDIIETIIDYRGKTPPKTATGIPLVTAKIVKNGAILPPNEFISPDYYDTWMTRGLPRKNDLLITTEAPLGEVALVEDENIALAQRIILIRCKNGICDSKYLKYFFMSDEGQYALQSKATGTTVEGIKQSVLRNVEVNLPSYDEQMMISNILSSFDDKINLLTRQIATLEALAQTYFRQWFLCDEETTGNKCTAGELIDFNPTRKVENTEAYYLDMSMLSTTAFNPEGWYARKYTSGVKFINGDTLLARITPCLENGKTAYVTFLDDQAVGWGSTEFIVMRPKYNLHTFFAYMLARNTDFRDYAEGCFEGTSGRQRVSIEHLKNYQTWLPTQSSITRFNNLASAIVPKLHSNATQIRSLKNLRDTLQPKLISGEVRVKQ